jgi:hypothetical protein
MAESESEERAESLRRIADAALPGQVTEQAIGTLDDTVEDAVRPNAIEHSCEELFSGGELVEKYNYIDYHFDCVGTCFRARAYLDEIETVTLHGPFDSATMTRTDGSLNEDVLAYLKRRFRCIKTYQGQIGAYALFWTET